MRRIVSWPGHALGKGTPVTPRRLLEFGAGFLYYLRAARLLGPHPVAEAFRRPGAHVGALLCEALLHLGRVEDPCQLGIELGDDIARDTRPGRLRPGTTRPASLPLPPCHGGRPKAG